MAKPDTETETAVLVTQTLLASSCELLDKQRPFSLASFFDFSAFCEAFILFDRFRYLSASSQLHEGRALDLIRGAVHLEEIGTGASLRELVELLSRLPENVIRHVDACFEIASDVPPDRLQLPYVNYSSSANRILEELGKAPQYPSGVSAGRSRAATQAFVYRSNAYLILASMHRLDYFPDFSRAPLLGAFANAMYRSIPVRIYDRVVESLELRGGVGEIDEFIAPMDLPMPAVTSAVLNRAANVGEIPLVLLELRKEFGSYRQYFAKFRKSIGSAASAREVARLKARYTKLLAEASGSPGHVVTAEQVINFAEKAVKPIAAPGVPTSYSSSLLLQPAEWLRRWWLRRPLMVIYRLDRHLQGLNQYSELIEKHWSVNLDDLPLEDYAAYMVNLSRLARAGGSMGEKST